MHKLYTLQKKNEWFNKWYQINHHPVIIFPSLAGIEKFKGQYFHSRDYKNPESFTGKRVIIIGLGNSGSDLAVEISHTAKQVWISKLFTLLHQGSCRWTQQSVWIPAHSPSVPMANAGLGFTASVGNIMIDDVMEPRLQVRFPSFIWPHTKEFGHDHRLCS